LLIVYRVRLHLYLVAMWFDLLIHIADWVLPALCEFLLLGCVDLTSI